MTDSIRWGIWGTGTVAQAFVRSLGLVPGIELAAVVSRDAQRSEQFASAFGVQRSYSNPNDMLGDPQLDIVYVASPNHLHKEHSLAVIHAGKSVLCEKPFALSAAEAREIADAARKQRVFCMEAMWMRFMPLVRRARALVMDGRIGKLLGLTADFALPLAESATGSAWQVQTGGGALLDRGIYCLSLASFLMGEPRQIASIATITPQGVDSTSSYALTYETGAFATLWSSFTAQGTNQAVIHGSQANLCLHEPFMRPHQLTLRSTRPPAVASHDAPRLPSANQRLKENPLVQHVMRRAKTIVQRPDDSWFEPVASTGYQFEAQEATRCLRSGLLESPDMPLDDSIRILAMADEIRRSWNVTDSTG